MRGLGQATDAARWDIAPPTAPQVPQALFQVAAAGSSHALEVLSAALPDMRIERTPSGAIVIMNPTKPLTGKRNNYLLHALTDWAILNGTGEVYDSSTGWTLPNVGSVRSPDASWLRTSRWDALTPESQSGYSHICPDFVVELLSDPGDLKDAQSKMLEYMRAGAALGWLIDPFARQVHIYRPDRSVVLQTPERVHGDPELPGFVLELRRIWGD